MAFPTSPSNDDLHTEFGRTYRYVSETNSWTAATTPAPENVISTVTAFESAADLPLVNNNPGDTTFVAEDNSFRLWTGNGWFEIALANTAPTITAGANASYTLDKTGTPTVITMSATDPEGTPIVWGYQVTSGSLEDTSITNVGGEFTITPGTVDATFDLTFTASDGVNIDTSASSFTLAFGPDWSLISQQAKIQASDKQNSDYFGIQVDISGDTVVVGSQNEDPDSITNAGSAYIFTRSGTTWTEQVKLTASDKQADDWFGSSVAISGDTVVVGAKFEASVATQAGSVYIFTGSGSTWTQQAKIVGSDTTAFNKNFGTLVAIDGDTVVVSTLAQGGNVYVFTRSGTTWTEQAKLISSDRISSDRYASSIAISGDTVVVSAMYEDPDTIADAGAAYIFTRSGSTWTQQAKIQASDAVPNDYFGSSVAISGDTVVVGAHSEDTGGSYAGAAYIFTRSGSTWTQQAKLKASDPGVNHYFGDAVAIDGNAVFVAAPRKPGGGAGYIFARSGSTWTQRAIINMSDPEGSEYFGNEKIAISGNTVIAGTAPKESARGAAYIFHVDD